jgi:hypothetical protein
VGPQIHSDLHRVHVNGLPTCLCRIFGLHLEAAVACLMQKLYVTVKYNMDFTIFYFSSTILVCAGSRSWVCVAFGAFFDD